AHRWSEDEPTFQDFQEVSSAPAETQVKMKGDSTGWAKVVRFCAEARRRGIAFGWADTYCIDKTSSAELDESIRSMFRWYRNSVACFLHLAGTATLGDLEGDEWFKRGWTLQELLAPSRILFFVREWVSLSLLDSEKTAESGIIKRISAITGVSVTELCTFAPSMENVVHKMCWAASRRVTRDEDGAYALMGIFGVSMPIAYGEGGDQAFVRLVEAIMMAGGHPTVLNW
ncbi:hypothetical protein CONPUDRAFT_16667, partial [Coniophora puteana RWD-64-598 SS2]